MSGNPNKEGSVNTKAINSMAVGKRIGFGDESRKEEIVPQVIKCKVKITRDDEKPGGSVTWK